MKVEINEYRKGKERQRGKGASELWLWAMYFGQWFQFSEYEVVEVFTIVAKFVMHVSRSV